MAQAEERFKYLGTWHDIMVAAQPNCHDIVERASALQLSCNPLQSVAQRAQTAAPVVGCTPGIPDFSGQRPLLLRTDFLLEATPKTPPSSPRMYFFLRISRYIYKTHM